MRANQHLSTHSAWVFQLQSKTVCSESSTTLQAFWSTTTPTTSTPREIKCTCQCSFSSLAHSQPLNLCPWAPMLRKPKKLVLKSLLSLTDLLKSMLCMKIRRKPSQLVMRPSKARLNLRMSGSATPPASNSGSSKA